MVRLLQQRGRRRIRKSIFLMGMDSLRDLPTWHEAAVAGGARTAGGAQPPRRGSWTGNQLERALPGVRSRVVILDMPELEIASHVIQQRVRNGQPIRHMVPRSRGGVHPASTVCIS
jgi:nicotinate-nucleotide adenylyltransferase